MKMKIFTEDNLYVAQLIIYVVLTLETLKEKEKMLVKMLIPAFPLFFSTMFSKDSLFF